tara:strand:- start:277 stop:1107 length:831 start_codon:yes stop_codon:yes gene_type:complete
MRNKHNKKRNVAFIYEALTLTITESIISKDDERKSEAMRILKEFFQDTEIAKEHEIYRSILECKGIDKEIAEKIIAEARRRHDSLDKQKLFSEQTALIKMINKNLDSEVFSTFVPSYKSLATISQMFGAETTIKDRVLLETKVVEEMVDEEKREEEKLEQIDEIVMNRFLEKFNSKYSGVLSENQKTLLMKYISSFSDNGLELKAYLNEEIGEIKSRISQLMEDKEVCDSQMLGSAKKVMSILESHRENPINDEMLKDVLKFQELVKEMDNHDDKH